MPRTKPLYVYPSDTAKYSSLLEELVDIQSRLQQGSTVGIKESIEKVAKELSDLKVASEQKDQELMDVVDDAKGVYPTINDRFLALDQYDLLNTLQRITTAKEYEYDSNGYVVKEKIRGDMNYDTTFHYNSFSEIIREVKTDLNGNVISEKDYTYTEEGNVKSVSGTNTDDIMLLSNHLVTKELDKRLADIERIDFVSLSKTLGEWDLINVAKTVQELATQVQHLMLNLPENIGYLIDTSEVFRRIDSIEKRIDASEVYYAFDVISTQDNYKIPAEVVGKKIGVYMEGLLLEKGVDYVINNDNILFLIPLIDGFTVTYKN